MFQCTTNAVEDRNIMIVFSDQGLAAANVGFKGGAQELKIKSDEVFNQSRFVSSRSELDLLQLQIR